MLTLAFNKKVEVSKSLVFSREVFVRVYIQDINRLSINSFAINIESFLMSGENVFLLSLVGG